MNEVINKNMQSASVKRAAAAIRVSEDDMWHIFYDTGLEYLNRFEQRIRRKRVWDAQFKKLLSSDRDFGNKSYTEVMDTIRNSSRFWFWWSVNFWSECKLQCFDDEAELRYNLQTNELLIPHFILTKIFYGKQEPECNQRADSSLAPKTSNATGEKREAGKRVGSRV